MKCVLCFVEQRITQHIIFEETNNIWFYAVQKMLVRLSRDVKKPYCNHVSVHIKLNKYTREVPIMYLLPDQCGIYKVSHIHSREFRSQSHSFLGMDALLTL